MSVGMPTLKTTSGPPMVLQMKIFIFHYIHCDARQKMMRQVHQQGSRAGKNPNCLLTKKPFFKLGQTLRSLKMGETLSNFQSQIQSINTFSAEPASNVQQDWYHK